MVVLGIGGNEVCLGIIVLVLGLGLFVFFIGIEWYWGKSIGFGVWNLGWFMIMISSMLVRFFERFRE